MQKRYLFVLFVTVLLLTTSCTRNATVAHQPNEDRSGEKWAQETNIDVNGTDKNITTDSKNAESAKLNNTVVPRVKFPLNEYKRLAKKGRATVRGMIYLDDGYGKKIYGKNTRLYLNPVTSYSKQWYQESYLRGKKMSKADAKLFNYVKFTASGEDGRFAFYGVSTGGYYITGSVVCGYECGYDSPKNIRIATEVYLHGNEIVNQDITKRAQ